MNSNLEPVDNWTFNQSFSFQRPRLQTALDSTSLGEFKTCPRKYYYSILCGYTLAGVQIDLEFGSAGHRLQEIYHRGRAEGLAHDEALDSVVNHALISTWDRRSQAPSWDDAQKNRLSLVRMAVEYFDHYEKEGTGPRTVMLADGRPAVELTFAFDSGYRASTGEPIVLCGHLDRLVQFNEDIYVSDLKTTRIALGTSYAARFTPDNQFTMYTIAGRVALSVPARGVLLDAVQIGATFVRFARFPIPRPQPVLDEWLTSLPYWLKQMDDCAARAENMPPEEAYPQNDKACQLYGGCQFRDVCARSPSTRQPILKANYNKRRWDPVGQPR